MSSLYDDWDPMIYNYYSFGNIARFQLQDPGALISGQTLRMREDVCPHSNDGKTCFKGPFCPYKHHIDANLVKENPKLGIVGAKERVFCLKDLPSKPVGCEGMMNRGIVVAALSPWEFYLLPMKSWECACKEGIETNGNVKTRKHYMESEPSTSNPVDVDEDEDVHGDSKNSGIEALNEMFQMLPEYANRRPNDSIHYVANELVAVQLETLDDDDQKKMLWFRAVVLEDVVLGDEMTSPQALLRLLDIGLLVMKSIQNVIRLPKIFCHVPPLAYKCSLFGVSPLSHRWSTSAIEIFKLLTEFQPCLFEVKRTIQLDDDGPPNLFEKNPYLVEVNVRVEKKYHNVAHTLAAEGLALQWNLTPSRPLVSAKLNGELWNLLASENNPGQSLKSSVTKDRQNLLQRERKRLTKLIGRLNICVDDDDSDASFHSNNSGISNSVEDLL